MIKVFWKFRVNPLFYRIISTDIGKEPGIVLRSDRIVGQPDVIFKHRFLSYYLVGEYKGRKARGYVKLNEYLQVILYCGMASAQFKTRKIKGRLCYKDKVVRIKPNRKVYDALIAMREDCVAARESWQKPPGAKPIHRFTRIPQFLGFGVRLLKSM